MWIRSYLVVYFVLVLAAAVALWRGDVLTRLPGDWVAAVLALALGLGVLLALVTFRRHPVDN